MKLAQLLNEERFTRSKDVIKAWLKDHGFTLADFKIIGGRVHANPNSKNTTAGSKIPPLQRPDIGSLPFEFADEFSMGLNLEYFGLRTLDGLPKRMTGHGFLTIAHNKLVDLKGCPEEVSYLTVANMGTLKSLAGGPKKCRDLHLANLSGLTTLKDVHKQLGTITKITFVKCDSIKDSILGLLLIDGLQSINIPMSPGNSNFVDALMIVRNYVGKGRGGLLAAQQELLDAGLDDFAKI